MMMSDMVLLHETRNEEGELHIGGAYGPELMLDCHGCEPKMFNRPNIASYLKALCKAIEMDAEDFHFWDDFDVPEEERRTKPHAKGTSVGGVFRKKIGLQFIITSSIIIHTLDELGRAYINVFSCKLFDEVTVKEVTYKYFKAKSIGSHLVQRS